MARRCPVSGKGVLVGMNVSHAHNRTKRRFLPNLQPASLLSEALGRSVRLRLTTNAIRTIEKRGGLDAYVLGTSASKLSAEMVKIKRQISKAVESKAA
ncbi:50S ribosomal protein L28 [Thalassospira alkalitolerans]|uniref:Large ribosomal subunit protein bL28 n=1 Tax=Thalassospira alkalitolerans TaxID=1293890 RepID=A0A1Y2L9S8_9PROT|nr:50S ribosomal protein L28 [Thalassospira alkalitolerans]OSQ47054.1 50S ribosomal protein L28 [Thalassospira alkalitolerans]|tara:strand:- start:64516 stop:64809 length:294 start_codon:yes stop_codon:yes gene_type:complete